MAVAVLLAIIAALIALTGVGLYREWKFWSSDERFPQSCESVDVIVPLKGAPQGLEENLSAIVGQRTAARPRYIFVVDDEGDPAYSLASKFGEVVVAGRRDDVPGKSWALARALERVSGDCVVLADDDIRPGPQWLESLTAPLSTYEASTTYRWYVGRGLCTRARAAVSNTAFTAMQHPKSRFLWGGSMALRREVVHKGGLPERLPRYISDDYAVYETVRELAGRIWFSKAAIAPTPDPECRWKDMFKWAVRQILMVKWYSRRGWIAGLVIYTLGFVFGIAVPTAGLALGEPALSLGFVLPLLNLAKDFVRARGVERWTGVRTRAGEVLATWALGNLVIPATIWASAFVKCVVWRGRRYCEEDAKRLVVNFK